MGLKTMSLLSGATVAATGGTALNFVDDGVSVSNGLHLACSSDSNFETRRQVTFKVRPFTRDAKTGKWNKDKKSVTLVLPRPQTDGTVVFETIRIERELLPSTTQADIDEFMKVACQLILDTDASGFWNNGSLS